MKTMLQTKIKTKTIAAIALVTLAAGSVVLGLTFVSKKTGKKLDGDPYAKNSQIETVPASGKLSQSASLSESKSKVASAKGTQDFMLKPTLSVLEKYKYGINPAGFGASPNNIYQKEYVPLSGALAFEGAMESTLNAVLSKKTMQSAPTEKELNTIFSTVAKERIEYMEYALADGANLRVILKDDKYAGSRVYVVNDGNQSTGNFNVGVYKDNEIMNTMGQQVMKFVKLTANTEYIKMLDKEYNAQLARLGARNIPKDKLINREDITLMKTIAVSGLDPFEIKEINTGIKDYCYADRCLRFAVVDIDNNVQEKNELDNVDMTIPPSHFYGGK